MKNELILACPTHLVWRYLKYEKSGVITMTDQADSNNRLAMQRILDESVFAPRPRLETRSDYKQIIPYGVIRCGEKTYLFRRTKGGGEARLFGCYSLGVGGHLNPQLSRADIDMDYLEAELIREMNEEVAMSPGCVVRYMDPIAFVNDDANEVGSVHLGVFFIIDVTSEDLTIRETDKLEGRWVTNEELLAAYPEMETWSQLYMRYTQPAAVAKYCGNETQEA